MGMGMGKYVYESNKRRDDEYVRRERRNRSSGKGTGVEVKGDGVW